MHDSHMASHHAMLFDFNMFSGQLKGYNWLANISKKHQSHGQIGLEYSVKALKVDMSWGVDFASLCLC